MKHLKINLSFVLGLVVGAMLFSGTAAFAAGILATPMSELGQQVTLNGEPITLEAYNINGNNYFKLRDIADVVDFGVVWDGNTRTVCIDTTTGYDPNATVPSDVEITPSTPSAEAISGKILTGDNQSREDYSQMANPDIFTSVYTRAAYNTLRQSIVDREMILSGNNADGFNSDYAYAHTTATPETKAAMNLVVMKFSERTRYSLGVEPYVKGYYNYPDYFICKVRNAPVYQAAADSLTYELAEINGLGSTADKVRLINDIVCEKLTYQASANAMPNTIFTASGVVGGRCSSYAHAVAFLCDLAEVPCVFVSSSTHAWNMVYVDDEWLYVDAVANDTADELSSREAVLLVPTTSNPGRVDAHPESTAFAMELLVPGSTR